MMTFPVRIAISQAIKSASDKPAVTEDWKTVVARVSTDYRLILPFAERQAGNPPSVYFWPPHPSELKHPLSTSVASAHL